MTIRPLISDIQQHQGSFCSFFCFSGSIDDIIFSVLNTAKCFLKNCENQFGEKSKQMEGMKKNWQRRRASKNTSTRGKRWIKRLQDDL